MIAALADRREGISCSSGTAALHLGVRALEIAEGDEVITTPFSFVASANCLLYERAIPRFVDIEEDSLGIDPDLVDGARTPRTRAVLPVHVFGRPCRIDDVVSIARRRGWAVIEDACEGLGSTTDGRPLGSFGDVAAFAFYPNKQITTGEGGMVVTDDTVLADTMRSLRNQGRDADGTWLRHVRLGYNYRLDELSAAVGVAQLERLEELRRGRARVVAAYERGLDGCDWATLPTPRAGRDRRLVRLCHPAAPGVRPRPDHHSAGRAGRSDTSVFRADPPAAVLPNDVRVPPRRLPGHRTGRGIHARHAVLVPPSGCGRPIRHRRASRGRRCRSQRLTAGALLDHIEPPTSLYPVIARRNLALAAKRGMDAAGAALGILVLSPVLAWTALATLITQGPPILFRHERAGLAGRPFTMLKFRTMRPPASGQVWYATDRQRITRLGRVLRSTSIDELPELWNVLRGDMSLVGPRPLPAEYLDRYTPEERRRQECARASPAGRS